MKHAVALSLSAALLATPAGADTVPATPQSWLSVMGDFSRNSLPLHSPQAFIGFLHAATEPEFHTTRMDRISEPPYWAKIADTGFSPQAAQNFGQAMNPASARDWAMAMIDPRFYQATLAVLSDAEKMERWNKALFNPFNYAAFLKPAEGDWYQRWTQSIGAPDNWQAVTNPLTGLPANPARN